MRIAARQPGHAQLAPLSQIGRTRRWWQKTRGPSVFYALVLTLAGCGYHLTGSKIGLPAEIHSIRVGDIENRTPEYGLEKRLRFALEREIHQRQQLRLGDSDSGADAVLSGRIRSAIMRPVAFNSSDQATQYNVLIVLDLSLKRERDGAILWKGNGIRQEAEYSTAAGVVLVSSSQFQQGTLDPANLNNPQLSPGAAGNPQAPSLQLGESDRERALARLLEQSARDVYDQMIEDF